MKVETPKIQKIFTRDEMTSDQWFRNGNSYRMYPAYGNWHVLFESDDAYIGIGHVDKYNALDFPINTFNHGGKYVGEELGIGEGGGKLLLLAALVWSGSKAYKHLKKRKYL